MSRCSALNNASGITIGSTANLRITCSSGTSTIGVPLTINSTGSKTDYNDDYGIDTVYNPSLEISKSGNSALTVTVEQLTLGANITYQNSQFSQSDTTTIQSLTRNGNTLTNVPGSSGKLIIDGAAVASEYRKVIVKQDSSSDYTDEISDKEYSIITGNQPNVDYEVLSGGILGGTGKVQTIKVLSGGKLAPGMSPGCFNSSNVDFQSGSIFEVELGGTVVCEQYDQQRVTGTVTINGGSILSISHFNQYKPKTGDTFIILSNDGSDAVTGTFKDLANGATFSFNGYTYQINYNGGDGNDVVLTIKNVPASPDTGIAILTQNPLAVLATTTSAAAVIYVIAKRYRPQALRR